MDEKVGLPVMLKERGEEPCWGVGGVDAKRRIILIIITNGQQERHSSADSYDRWSNDLKKN